VDDRRCVVVWVFEISRVSYCYSIGWV
jgi:hypothetical protein